MGVGSRGQQRVQAQLEVGEGFLEEVSAEGPATELQR